MVIVLLGHNIPEAWGGADYIHQLPAEVRGWGGGATCPSSGEEECTHQGDGSQDNCARVVPNYKRYGPTISWKGGEEGEVATDEHTHTKEVNYEAGEEAVQRQSI